MFSNYSLKDLDCVWCHRDWSAVFPQGLTGFFSAWAGIIWLPITKPVMQWNICPEHPTKSNIVGRTCIAGSVVVRWQEWYLVHQNELQFSYSFSLGPFLFSAWAGILWLYIAKPGLQCKLCPEHPSTSHIVRTYCLQCCRKMAEMVGILSSKMSYNLIDWLPILSHQINTQNLVYALFHLVIQLFTLMYQFGYIFNLFMAQSRYMYSLFLYSNK